MRVEAPPLEDHAPRGRSPNERRRGDRLSVRGRCSSFSPPPRAGNPPRPTTVQTRSLPVWREVAGSRSPPSRCGSRFRRRAPTIAWTVRRMGRRAGSRVRWPRARQDRCARRVLPLRVSKARGLIGHRLALRSESRTQRRTARLVRWPQQTLLSPPAPQAPQLCALRAGGVLDASPVQEARRLRGDLLVQEVRQACGSRSRRFYGAPSSCQRVWWLRGAPPSREGRRLYARPARRVFGALPAR